MKNKFILFNQTKSLRVFFLTKRLKIDFHVNLGF